MVLRSVSARADLQKDSLRSRSVGAKHLLPFKAVGLRDEAANSGGLVMLALVSSHMR
jgi:hypothetical protein